MNLAAVLVLGESVDGWDAVETELRSAVPGKLAEELGRVRTATQVRQEMVGCK